MSEFITLTCPSCGGKLQVTDNIAILACGHCRSEHMVRREGGAIYLAPLAQDVRHIRVNTDKTAAELAIVRLSKEIEELQAKLDPLLPQYNIEKRRLEALNRRQAIRNQRQAIRNQRQTTLNGLSSKGCVRSMLVIMAALFLLSAVAAAAAADSELFASSACMFILVAVAYVIVGRWKQSAKPKLGGLSPAPAPQPTISPPLTSPLVTEVERMLAELNFKRDQLQKNRQIVDS